MGAWPERRQLAKKGPFRFSKVCAVSESQLRIHFLIQVQLRPIYECLCSCSWCCWWILFFFQCSCSCSARGATIGTKNITQRTCCFGEFMLARKLDYAHYNAVKKNSQGNSCWRSDAQKRSMCYQRVRFRSRDFCFCCNGTELKNSLLIIEVWTAQHYCTKCDGNRVGHGNTRKGITALYCYRTELFEN